MIILLGLKELFPGLLKGCCLFVMPTNIWLTEIFLIGSHQSYRNGEPFAELLVQDTTCSDSDFSINANDSRMCITELKS